MKSMVTVLALAALAATAWVQTGWAQTGWEADLAMEIERAERCKVAYLSHVVERTVEGRQIVMAKAHCEDQRVFDAMRPDELAAFRFNECQPDTGTSC